jgi:hypothetical protein
MSFDQHTYHVHILTTVSNNPEAVANKMRSTGRWNKITVTVEEYFDFLSKTTTINPSELAQLVASTLDVPTLANGPYADWLTMIKKQNPNVAMRDIAFQLAYAHYEDQKMKIDPKTLADFQRGDKENGGWRLAIGIVVILAIVGGAWAFLRMAFGGSSKN